MHKLLCTSVILFLAFGMTAILKGQEPASLQIDSNPAALRQFVRQAVSNDVDDQKLGVNKEMYRQRKETPRGSQVKEIVETKTISVARLLEFNDKPLTSEQQQAEEARLNTLAGDPEAQRKKLKEEKQDSENATRIFRALPDAFIYKYEGTQQGGFGEIVRLSFKPDPGWSPTSREVQVLTGMQGTLDIDKHDVHVVKIEAHLFRDVDFGWGILGRLYRGGSFLVEQTKIGEHRWETSHMVLNITGKALLFKTLSFKETQSFSDFQPVPPDLSVRDGIELLRKVSLAKNTPEHEPLKCAPCEPK